MKKILLIEDDRSIRSALSSVLEDAYYEVVTASNGQEAMEMLKDTQFVPHLILLDLLMPVMNGFEFRKAQLEDNRLSPIPVILLTANNHLKDHQESLQAYEFLNKPIEIKDLLYIVENFFLMNDHAISL